MRLIVNTVFAITIFALALGAGACSTAAPAATPTKPAGAAVEPTTKPSTGTTPTAAAALATATPASGGISVGDLVSRAKGTPEYSADTKSTVAGQTISSKIFFKGTKMRQESSIAGIQSVMILDLSAKTGYTFQPGSKTAMKMDFSQLAASGTSPSDASGLPGDAKVVGADTVDGKLAAVVEYSTSGSQIKTWYWVEKGLPLKSEITAGTSKVITEYSNYQFGPLADSLFELPPGTTVTELPTFSLTPPGPR